ncbi:MAG: PspC domain-containing protein [Paenibacillaceae bacterium]|nr:PspC domain-containing protein [Paenibacillaceae bacterium]
MTKLYRSSRDKKLFGLCGGLAEMLNLDATLLRLVVVIVTVFTGGSVILIYIVASMVIPKEPGYDGFAMYGHMPPPPSTPPSPGFRGSAGSMYGPAPQRPQAPAPVAHHPIDEMMKDIEKKAMQKELEELRAKLAKYEKGDE